MQITILAAGTRGDTQPYIALGKELMKHGNQVRLATFENYASFVQSHGLEFFPISGDVSQFTTSKNAKNARGADNPLKVLLSFSQLKNYVFTRQREFYDACQNTNLIIFHPGMPIGYFAAQQMKIPSVLATPFPMTPTREFPALIFYNSPRLGGSFNWMTHKIFEQIMWFPSSSAVKSFWKEKFGRIPDDFGCPFERQTTRNLPTIVSCSDYVFPKPNDWPEGVHNTGYWFLDEEPDWKPPHDLVDFLKKGKPPVYFGFGSLGDPELADRTTEIVLEALKLSGQRGILATGWNSMSKRDRIPKDIFILESIPHSWLFPRMASVVHHGGAATTAAGFKAGVPTIIIPFSNDQFAWGRRAFELGVGPQPIPRKSLTAEKLAEAITKAYSPEIISNSMNLGQNIQSENGTSLAVKIILNSLV